MKLLILGAFALLLSTGCASTAFKKDLEGLLNQPSDTLLARYGTPSAESAFSNGDKLWTYNFSGGNRAVAIANGNAIHAVSSPQFCTMRFRIETLTQTVMGYNWSGNACY